MKLKIGDKILYKGTECFICLIPSEFPYKLINAYNFTYFEGFRHLSDIEEIKDIKLVQDKHI